jgi:deazaflavin-dependent oxidoreductase (nitroreductase family)
MTGRRPAPASAGPHALPLPDKESTVSEPSTKSPYLQPRWFIRSFWVLQRALYSVTRGHLGLRSARADRWGMMRLRTVGRRTGEERRAILGYFEDGPDLVTMAMNGWADPEPAWWLNLQAHPDATVDLPGGSRAVRARACGSGGPSTTRISTATRPCDRARPQS